MAALGLGAAWAVAGGVKASPARADAALDVRILQTASSLEALGVAFYDRVLGQDAGVLSAFAQEARRQHEAHKRAFQAQMAEIDRNARVQDAPNPRFVAVVSGTDVATATVLEKLTTDTYLENLTQLQDARAKAVVAGVMALGAQRLATLRTVAALLGAGSVDLVAFPLPQTAIMRLPVVAGRAAFPDGLHQLSGPELIADPASGALS